MGTRAARDGFQSLEVRPAGFSNRWKWLFPLLFVLGLTTGTGAAPDPQSVMNTRHNLSASGPGTVKSFDEPEVCIFCHTTHTAAKEAPLWNRFQSAAVYTPYSSTTMKAKPGQPTGSSKLCLSCHDGTVAMGMLRSRPTQVRMTGGSGLLSRGTASNLGTDLSDDHPISFVYDSALARQDGELRDPGTLPKEVALDDNRQLQCSTCHDAHNNRYGKFLVRDNTASALCTTCHDPRQWQQSVHRTSAATWNGKAPDPWPHTPQSTVAANACENCHKPHTAGSRERLLNFPGEEDNCFSCHNGNVAAKNIQNEFQKFSAHMVSRTTGVHDPIEDAVEAPRHVECADCHNAHAARHAPASAPTAPGALEGVRGISASGNELPAIQNEYELCFRCHGDSSRKGPARVNRISPQTNTRLEFSPSNVSFHPVEAAGRNADVPSLRPPYTTSSRIYCSDCHNNNEGPGAGGNGPAGPHGSIYTPLLERQLVLTDFTAESEQAYALCYKCHDRGKVLENTFHRQHVVEQQTACTTCHDSHAAGSTHLINFNVNYVSAFNGQLAWTDQGEHMGTCTLACHGVEHDRLSVAETPATALKSLLRRPSANGPKRTRR